MKRSKEFNETLDYLLSKIPRPVILQGSRSRLPEAKIKHSDWDFAVQYDEALDDWCSVTGWTVVCDPNYTDDNTQIVYEKIIDGNTVQLSLRNDLGAFARLWSTITPEFFENELKKMDRESMKEWFNENYRFL